LSEDTKFIIYVIFLIFLEPISFLRASSNDVKEVGDQSENVVIDWEYKLGNDTLKSIKIKYQRPADSSSLMFALKMKGQTIQLNEQEADAHDFHNIIVKANDTSLARVILKKVLSSKENGMKFVCEIKAESGNEIQSYVTLKVYGMF